MSTWYEWSVRCATDNNVYKTITKTPTPPTVCPENSQHTVVSGSQLIVNKLTRENPTLTDLGESRLLVSIGMFPDYMNPTFFARGDDFDAGTRGTGDRLVFSHADGTPEVNISDFRFTEPIHLIGATVRCVGANIDDYISFELVVPATSTTVNNTSTGNCNLYPLGEGANMIIPAANDGTHDVPFETAVNSNLNGDGGGFKVCNVSLVPAADDITHEPNGYWSLNMDTGVVSPANGDGQYNLFTFDITMVRFINQMTVFGSPYKEEVGVNHRSALCLPHWIYRVTTTRSSTHLNADPPVQYSVIMKAARKKTT